MPQGDPAMPAHSVQVAGSEAGLIPMRSVDVEGSGLSRWYPPCTAAPHPAFPADARNPMYISVLWSPNINLVSP